LEFFWKTIPFLVPILIMVIAYQQYKNRGNEISKDKKPSWLEQQQWYQYIKLVFFTRVFYRQWTAIWHVPLFFSIIFGFGTLIANLTYVIYPPLPLEKMQKQQGVIESIVKRKKMDDLLILRTNDGVQKSYAYRLYGSESKYLNQNVTIFYTKGFSSLFSTDNVIYQVASNNTKEILDKYDYERVFQNHRSFWKFTKTCFYIAMFSAFMIWIFNRKELPIHRLNRIKLHKIKT
jgi:hypothetical protein